MFQMGGIFNHPTWFQRCFIFIPIFAGKIQIHLDKDLCSIPGRITNWVREIALTKLHSNLND